MFPFHSLIGFLDCLLISWPIRGVHSFRLLLSSTILIGMRKWSHAQITGHFKHTNWLYSHFEIDSGWDDHSLVRRCHPLVWRILTQSPMNMCSRDRSMLSHRIAQDFLALVSIEICISLIYSGKPATIKTSVCWRACAIFINCNVNKKFIFCWWPDDYEYYAARCVRRVFFYGCVDTFFMPGHILRCRFSLSICNGSSRRLHDISVSSAESVFFQCDALSHRTKLLMIN